MKVSGIYKIQSIIKPGKIYIGSASNIRKRRWEHLCNLRNNKHANKKLQYHYNKYGESDFQFSVLLGCEKEDMIKHEQFFIDSLKPVLNICQIAGNTLGVKRSDEYKKALSERMKGTKRHLGYKHSEESRKKMSENSGCRGSKWNLGRKHTEEELNKMRGLHHDENFREMRRKIMTGRAMPDETRKKISETLKTKHIVPKTGFKNGQTPWNKGLKFPYKKRQRTKESHSMGGIFR
jgi:hypothetical protein